MVLTSVIFSLLRFGRMDRLIDYRRFARSVRLPRRSRISILPVAETFGKIPSWRRLRPLEGSAMHRVGLLLSRRASLFFHNRMVAKACCVYLPGYVFILKIFG